MTFHVSLVNRTDLSGEIYRQLRRAIVDGRLRPGDRLPATRHLARSLSVSRMTVSIAYDRLAGEGFVTSRVGAGTFVSAGLTRTPERKTWAAAAATLRPRPVWDSVVIPTVFDLPAAFDFRSGLPDGSLFPFASWRRLLAGELNSGAAASGPYGDPAGHRGLRAAIVRHIGISRGMQVSAADVTITSGTQQALDLITRVILNSGDQVAVEDPGYGPPRQLFRTAGMKVAAVPVDAEGLIVDAIPRNVRAVYVTPSHQYPLGVAMSLSRRLALLDWAERNGVAIVEDDYDSEFRFSGRPIEPVQTLDRSGRVIYVGSFSKTLLPTLRLGFVVTPPALSQAMRRAKFIADWHTPLFTQGALAQFIRDGGFARHLRRMANVYRARRDLIVRILEQDFADHLELISSATGLHLAASARHGSPERMAAIVTAAMEKGVALYDLAMFRAGKSARAGLVLGYGAIPTNRVAEGLSRVRRLFDERSRRRR